MTYLDEQGRPADETATLLGFLEYQRATLAWKCAGLDAAGLRATVGASSMTLGGLLKHLAYVEDLWFSAAAEHSRPASAPAPDKISSMTMPSASGTTTWSTASRSPPRCGNSRSWRSAALRTRAVTQ